MIRYDRWMAALAGLVVFAQLAPAATLDYQGRITSEGKAFSGTGYFKFELQDGGKTRLWRNDGSVEGREPEKAVRVDVQEGLFTVQLGDTEAGMVPISALAFHASGVTLRTWFSDSRRGPFEALRPDVAIRSLDLAQLNTGDMVVVDEAGGDFSDLQDAVNMVATNPAFRVVLVMPGRYVMNTPLRTVGRSAVIVRGMGRDAVQVGNLNGAAVAGFNGSIEGVTLEGRPAVDSSRGGNLTLRDCALRGGGGAAAVQAAGPGALTISGCRIRNAAGAGVEASGNPVARIQFSEIAGAPAVVLAGTDAAKGAVPEVVQCVLTSPEGTDALALKAGASKGDIRLLNSTLYGTVGDNVTLVPAGKTLANGNVVVPAAGAGE